MGGWVNKKPALPNEGKMLTGYGWKCDQCFKVVEPKTNICDDCHKIFKEWSDKNWKGYQRTSDIITYKTGNAQTPTMKFSVAEKQHILNWDRTKKKCSEKYGY